MIEEIVNQIEQFQKADLNWRNESGYFDNRPVDDGGESAFRRREYNLEVLEEIINRYIDNRIRLVVFEE